MSGRRPSWLAAALMLSSLAVAAAPAVAQSAANPAFEQAADLYRRGRTEESLQKFREVLAASPSPADALAMWDSAGQDVLMRMLLAPGEQSTIARRFADLAKVGRKQKSADAEAIKALVNQVVTGDYRAQRDAIDKLIANHGAYAVEFLYPTLGDPDNLAARVNVIYALFRLGEDAVLPLIQVLKSSSDQVRANAAGLLGKIGDLRAIPALAALGNGDASEMVRGEARTALKGLSAGLPGGSVAELPGGSAAGLYVRQSQAYLKQDAAVLKPWSLTPVIWSWEGDKLTKREVPPELFAAEMARGAAVEALALDAANRPAHAALAAASAAIKAEIGGTRAAGGELPADADAMVAQADVSLGLAGRDVLLDALGFTLDQNLALASAALIDELGRLQATGPALERALESRDKLVRYPAAFALAQARQSGANVVQVLVEALGEAAVRNILLIDDQDENRNAMASSLTAKGYNVLSASSAATGLVRLHALPRKDLILVRTDLKDLTVDAVVDAVKSDPRNAATPILLISSRARLEDDAKMYDGKVAGAVESGSAPAVYLATIAASLPESKPEQDAAQAVGARAARCLAHMDASALGPAIDALSAVLDAKPNEVREPALWALSMIGPPKAVKGAAALFGDAASPKELRIAAAHALVAILRNLAADPGPDVMGALAEGLKAEDAQVRRAAAEALGAAQFLTPAQRSELLLGHPSP